MRGGLTGAAAVLAGFGAVAAALAMERLVAPTFGDTRPVLTALEMALLCGAAWGAARPGRTAGAWAAAALIGSAAAVARATAFLPADLLMAPWTAAALAFVGCLAGCGGAGWAAAAAATAALRRLGIGRGGVLLVVGAALGLVATPFVLLPVLGTRLSLLTAAIALALQGGVPDRRRAVAQLTVAAVATAAGWAGPSRAAGGESPEGHVAVRHEAGLTLLATGSGVGVQSAWRPGGLTGLYTDDLALAPFALTGRQRARALMIGFGGGSAVRLWRRFGFGPDRLRVDGVEADPMVARLARRRFGSVTAGVAVHVADGRVGFAALAPRRYDLVVLDAYRREAYLPFALTTVAFDRALAARLRPGGSVWLNVNAPSAEDRLIRDVAATLEAAFPSVRLARARGAWNWLVVAGGPGLDGRLEALRATRRLPAPLRPVAAALRWRRPPTGGRRLTEDRADVEGPADRDLLVEILGAVTGSGRSPQRVLANLPSTVATYARTPGSGGSLPP